MQRQVGFQKQPLQSIAEGCTKCSKMARPQQNPEVVVFTELRFLKFRCRIYENYVPGIVLFRILATRGANPFSPSERLAQPAI